MNDRNKPEPIPPTTHEHLLALSIEVGVLAAKIDEYRKADDIAHDDINKELEELKIIATTNQMILEKYKGVIGGVTLVFSGIAAVGLFILQWIKGEN
jgi:hypothetical protein